MTKIYQNGKQQGKALIINKSDLEICYPDGVEISKDPLLLVKFDEEAS